MQENISEITDNLSPDTGTNSSSSDYGNMILILIIAIIVIGMIMYYWDRKEITDIAKRGGLDKINHDDNIMDVHSEYELEKSED